MFNYPSNIIQFAGCRYQFDALAGAQNGSRLWKKCYQSQPLATTNPVSCHSRVIMIENIYNCDFSFLSSPCFVGPYFTSRGCSWDHDPKDSEAVWVEFSLTSTMAWQRKLQCMASRLTTMECWVKRDHDAGLNYPLPWAIGMPLVDPVYTGIPLGDPANTYRVHWNTTEKTKLKLPPTQECHWRLLQPTLEHHWRDQLYT